MNAVVLSRLEIIAAKAKILAEKYKNNQFWEGELRDGLAELEAEIAQIVRNSGDVR